MIRHIMYLLFQPLYFFSKLITKDKKIRVQVIKKRARKTEIDKERIMENDMKDEDLNVEKLTNQNEWTKRIHVIQITLNCYIEYLNRR